MADADSESAQTCNAAGEGALGGNFASITPFGQPLVLRHDIRCADFRDRHHCSRRGSGIKDASRPGRGKIFWQHEDRSEGAWFAQPRATPCGQWSRRVHVLGPTGQLFAEWLARWADIWARSLSLPRAVPWAGRSTGPSAQKPVPRIFAARSRSELKGLNTDLRQNFQD